MAVTSIGEADVTQARAAIRRGILVGMFAITCAMAALSFVATRVASLLTDAEPWRDLLAMSVLLVAFSPVAVGMFIALTRIVARSDAVADARQQQLDSAARRQSFAARVADALEMAADEAEALRTVQRSFDAVLPTQAVELLLADNSHAHLSRMAYTAPTGEPPGCGVASPQDCPAARRARVHHFPDSDEVNACPKLEGRSIGRCSAVCVPVSVMGRTVGVIHTIAEPHAVLPTGAEADLQAIANEAGARLGMLRIMAETQLQATTDALTGLLNRRSFENTFLGLDPSARQAATTMADLDHFKQLNDTYGHETGDRALRIFAETLRGCLRSEDLVARRGGEEFAVFFPGRGVAEAIIALERVRHQFTIGLLAAGLPSCTASFGVVESQPGENLEVALGRADVALFAAKHGGRDRIVAHDVEGNAIVFEPSGAESATTAAG